MFMMIMAQINWVMTEKSQLSHDFASQISTLDVIMYIKQMSLDWLVYLVTIDYIYQLSLSHGLPSYLMKTTDNIEIYF